MVRKAIIGLVAAAALLAGCGGGDSSISKQEYDQQLEVVCNRGVQEREEVTQKMGQEYEEGKKKKKGLEAATEGIRKLITVYEGTTEEIAAIGLPEQDEKKAEELVQAREDAAAEVEADPLASVGINSTTFDKVKKVSDELGAKSCGV